MNHLPPKIILLFSAGIFLFCGCDVSSPKQPSPATGQPVAAKPSPIAADPVPETPASPQEQTLESVQQLLGEPNGSVISGNRTVLLYGGEMLEFIDGKWVNPQADIQERIEASRKMLAKQAKEAAVQPKQAKTTPRPAEPRPAVAKTHPAATKISRDTLHSSLLVPGKITVVDFYADWCGPCRQMAPALAQMVSGKTDVSLKKVNIVNWDSAVAKKYSITSIPNVRVFDKNGRMVGSPTSDPNQVARNIEQARKNQ